ncbi:MAG: aminoacyl-tRNA hydrolase [Phycisphaerae bacterium]|nr:aminoacyl-tRNA hydrolase [Phycisphaerae bacterium]
MIEIGGGVEIDERDVAFEFSRSSGPGGQNVNKVSTRVTLLFDVGACGSLSDEQKGRLRRRLGTRINKEGLLRVVSQRHRTQAANKEAAIARFAELLGEALKRRPVRRKTRVPRGAVERRLQAKKQRGQLKEQRRGSIDY